MAQFDVSTDKYCHVINFQDKNIYTKNWIILLILICIILFYDFKFVFMWVNAYIKATSLSCKIGKDLSKKLE